MRDPEDEVILRDFMEHMQSLVFASEYTINRMWFETYHS